MVLFESCWSSRAERKARVLGRGVDEGEESEDIELLSDHDEAATKLELAYAYQKMGDIEGAREILQEVIEEGTKEQVKEAENSLASLDNSYD